MKDQQRRRTDVRSWGIPIVLTALGAYAWACVDDPDLSGSESTGGGEAETSASGSGPSSSAATMTSAGTTTEGTTTDAPTTTSPGTGDPSVTPRDVLESIAYQVIVPATAEFAAEADELQVAVDAYAAAVAVDPIAAGAQLSAAHDAWRNAMMLWQRLEVMQIGPAAPSVSAIAGENLRDQIYSWPTVDTCTVDRRVADGTYAEEDFFVTELPYAYGLDALEYLLFRHDMGHTCGAAVQLDGPWAALGFEEIERRRGAYAAVLAAEIARQADVLQTRWSPEGDDFASLLANPGGDSPFENEKVALDDVFRAMFYVDKQTKDAKLGLPLGLIDGCAAPPCADLVEAEWSDASAPAIAENLRGLQRLVWGGADAASGNGFDDLLVGAGHPELATELHDAIEAAIADAEGIDGALDAVIVNDTARVESLHAAVRAVTMILKGPLVMILMLEIPAEGVGDAD